MQNQEKQLDARWFLRLVRRWWWLLISLPILFGLVAYAAGSHRQRQYVAKTTLIVEPAQSSGPLDDYYTILASRGLATTYRELVDTRPVLEPVIGDLKLGYSWETLGKKVSASTVGDSQLLQLSASDADPGLAAAIANSVAQHFSQFVVDQAQQASTPTRTVLVQRISDYDQQISQTQQAIEQLQTSADAGKPSVQAQLAPLNSTLDQLRTSRADLQTKLDTVDVNDAIAKTRIAIAVPATIPTTPSTPSIVLVVLFGLVTGGVVAGGLASFFEYVNGPITAETDFARLAGAPLLMAVPQPRLRGAQPQPLFVLTLPNSAPAEAVLRLAADVKRATATRGIKSVAITSAEPDGATALLTANLGVVLASIGLATVIVDADGKGNNQARLFGIDGTNHSAMAPAGMHRGWREATEAVFPNLWVILLRSKKSSAPMNFGSVIDVVGRDVDVVLIAAPPAAVSEWHHIGAHVDCALLTCRALDTRQRKVRRAASAVRQLTRLLGIVVWQRGVACIAPTTMRSDEAPGAGEAVCRENGRSPTDGAWINAGLARDPRIAK
jgi:capsular polysaccharide biosynthesis protein/Mrp family chromosome partitioning ATPase